MPKSVVSAMLDVSRSSALTLGALNVDNNNQNLQLVNDEGKPNRLPFNQNTPSTYAPITPTTTANPNQPLVAPSVFDLFYEEILTQLLSVEDIENEPSTQSSDVENRQLNRTETKTGEQIAEQFSRLESDLERVEYIFEESDLVNRFRLQTKLGIKSEMTSSRYREEGNRMFQAEQIMQSLLLYNKSLSYAPHPTYDTWINEMNPVADYSESNPNSHINSPSMRQSPAPQFLNRPFDQRETGIPTARLKRQRPKYESLSLCYANRSATLRRLGQFDACLKDIERAMRFGYPRENLHRLFERKAMCYKGLSKYHMAVQAYQASVGLISESALTEEQKMIKTQEMNGAIKEITLMNNLCDVDTSSSQSHAGEMKQREHLDPIMGATGPLIFIPETEAKKKSTLFQPTPTPPLPQEVSQSNHLMITNKPGGSANSVSNPSSPLPPTPDSNANPPSRKSSFRREKKNKRQQPIQTTPDSVSMSLPPSPTQTTINQYSSTPIGQRRIPTHTPDGIYEELNSSHFLYQKNDSQQSISQMSGTGIRGSVGSSGGTNNTSKQRIEVPELTQGHHPRMPSASTTIDLRFTPERGRFFVATCDLKPGDVVLSEEPYAAVLDSVFRVNHCAHCLKKTPTPVPCFECTTVQYCSETCRDLSWVQYHRLECGILAYLEPSRYLGRMTHLALRIVTKTGIKNLLTQAAAHQSNNYYHSNESIFTTDLPPPEMGGPITGQSALFFDPTSYKSVHNLATNCEKRPFEDLLKRTVEAIFMCKCLKFNNFFNNPYLINFFNGGVSSVDSTVRVAPIMSGSVNDFNNNPSPQMRRFEIFVASLLLRHLQIVSTNGLQMAECILKNNDVTKFDIIGVGGAIFPTMSFFNHSCHPNAQRVGYENQQVVRIVRSANRGDEINIDYGFDFYATQIEARQRRAKSQYFFECECEACVNGWPTYNELISTRSRQLAVRLTNELSQELQHHEGTYQLAMDYLLKLDIARAMPLFRSVLVSIDPLVSHPDSRYIDCEEAYKQCLWLENRGHKVKSSPITAYHPN